MPAPPAVSFEAAFDEGENVTGSSGASFSGLAESVGSTSGRSSLLGRLSVAGGGFSTGGFSEGTVPISAGTAAKPWSAKMGLSPLML